MGTLKASLNVGRTTFNHAPIYGTYDVPYKNGQQNGIAIYGHRLLLFHAKMIPYKEKTKKEKHPEDASPECYLCS